MSYSNPEILTIDNATGLDAVIKSIQTDLATIPWLQKSFGRAWEFTEKQESRVVRVPKVYQGESEYLNVLPNDHLSAQSFIMADGPEEWTEYDRAKFANTKERKPEDHLLV
jgi:hypothetical protein